MESAGVMLFSPRPSTLTKFPRFTKVPAVASVAMNSSVAALPELSSGGAPAQLDKTQTTDTIRSVRITVGLTLEVTGASPRSG